MSDPSRCAVCETALVEFDRAVVLGRYDETYRRCPDCGLVALTEVPWLPEAYESAIHDTDIGLLRRARRNAALTAAIISAEGLKRGRFLDWAGGYGVFTQLMRDKSLDFWQHDDYAVPVFAKDFQDDGTTHCDLVTAFEVVEHLQDPVTSIGEITARTDRLLFSTETLPDPPPRVADWWYYMPDSGQHITFHTPESLRRLGEKLGFRVTTNRRNWHMFHRDPLDVRTRVMLSDRANRSLRLVRDTGLAVRARLR